MVPYDAEFYRSQQTRSRQAADVIVPQLVADLKPSSVLDVGCGVGTWLAAFADNGVQDLTGVDGEYVSRDALQIAADAFRPHDLEKPLDLGRHFDLAICLEVAEHLSSEAAPTLVDSLVGAADVVLFSAAIPHQGGTDHINEQWPEYWYELFHVHGFRWLDPYRLRYWNDERVVFHYAQNMLIYAAPDACDAFATPLPPMLVEPPDGAPPRALVHRDAYLSALVSADEVRSCDLAATLPRPWARVLTRRAARRDP